ncbi:hypothetical protein AMD24_00611 [Candidatus Xiphinematobacter sp. Idaho Grape]|uniref:YbjQ family protein n=1 Tax=Candidatus Xiphinematobacter sp. Idaho Grape TaxID=1704307 RepID=UPI000705EA6C|nr:heavy metal-binding domain-containing protein [Candidatus Xiphinematobacter sp. Idaho Grape]ALJ56778.1 hypothetical protein AMD24_00611 [Candidatus Xiphinematobacter sp. Idaho Grape]
MDSVNFFTTTANELVGYQIVRQLGIVHGAAIRFSIGAQRFLDFLKMITGNRKTLCTRVCERARQEALHVLIAQASERGANALLAVHYDSTELPQSITEVFAYGTAVVVKPTNFPSP